MKRRAFAVLLLSDGAKGVGADRHVGLGSNSDLVAALIDVGSSLKNRHSLQRAVCPICLELTLTYGP